MIDSTAMVSEFFALKWSVGEVTAEGLYAVVEKFIYV
jgi:hypothetical protein